MVSRSDVEVGVRSTVAYDILSKPLSSLGQKADRRKNKVAAEVASYLKEGDKFERVFAYIEVRPEEERARTLREGIDAFKAEHPRYGTILEGMIEETRTANNRYLVYGVSTGFSLGAEDYRRVMKDLGMNSREADAMYPHLLDISDRLGKARENARRDILL